MSILSRFFNKRQPDGLLEFADRVYVFRSCFGTEVTNLHEMVNNLKQDFPESSFLAFDFQEAEKRESGAVFAKTLRGYGVTVNEYPMEYEGCALLTLPLIKHFLHECESWLARGNRRDVILLLSGRQGWPLLAFLVASFLLLENVHGGGERKALEAVHGKASKIALLDLQLSSSLDPFPSQIRYLQHVSGRNTNHVPERELSLDCLIFRDVPHFDSRHGGCRPIIRTYGRNLNSTSGPSTGMSNEKKPLRHYRQVEHAVIKFDIQCLVQGDVVLESNILVLNSDELDVLWEAKDHYPKGFRVEVLFDPTLIVNGGLPIEAFSRVEQLFSSVGSFESGDGDGDDDASFVVANPTFYQSTMSYVYLFSAFCRFCWWLSKLTR